MLVELLSQLCTDLELEMPQTKDDQGRYVLSFNPTLSVYFKELEPGLFFHTQIGPCPTKKREEFYTLLMKANFLGQGTGGACLAMDADERNMTFSWAIPYDVNYKIFKGLVEDFTNYADFWKEELVHHENNAESSLL
jgi:hypothetical protein